MKCITLEANNRKKNEEREKNTIKSLSLFQNIVTKREQ